MLPACYRFFTRYPGLDMARRDQRAFRLVGVDIDETDVQAGKRLSAFYIHGVMDDARAVGQMAAVPAGKGTGNLDILDRVIVAVAEREGDQGLGAQPAAS